MGNGAARCKSRALCEAVACTALARLQDGGDGAGWRQCTSGRWGAVPAVGGQARAVGLATSSGRRRAAERVWARGMGENLGAVGTRQRVSVHGRSETPWRARCDVRSGCGRGRSVVALNALARRGLNESALEGNGQQAGPSQVGRLYCSAGLGPFIPVQYSQTFSS
jgi:hypothetical protein